MRAMRAQASIIQSLASDFQMTLAASAFQRALDRQAASKQPFTRADAEAWASRLLSFLPRDAERRANAA
jgi:hypothetical protein